MHEPVKSRLEEYLSDAGSFPEVEVHLKSCRSCQTQVDEMRRQALLLRGLRAPREMDPSAGFYARVMNRIEAQAQPSVWSLFGESLFARRLGYASAALLLLMGTFLVTSKADNDVVATSGAASILTSDDVNPPIEVHPRQRAAVLVNLASYQQDFQ